VINSNEEVVNRYRYTPYGESEVKEEQVYNPYQYTGRRYDEESGLYYYRARMYSPEQKRFTSSDPAGMMAGPNRYAYAGNNPVNNRDPSGMFPNIINMIDGGGGGGSTDEEESDDTSPSDGGNDGGKGDIFTKMGNFFNKYFPNENELDWDCVNKKIKINSYSPAFSPQTQYENCLKRATTRDEKLVCAYKPYENCGRCCYSNLIACREDVPWYDQSQGQDECDLNYDTCMDTCVNAFYGLQSKQVTYDLNTGVFG